VELLKAIRSRRSIRKYKSDPVSSKDIKAIVDAARLAPSWKNNQCWRFIVIKDIATRDKLAETLPETNRGRFALHAAPVAIAICAELGRSGIVDGKAETDKGDWYMFDTALAAENLVLAAWAKGLGTVHLGLFDAKKAAEILNIPEGYTVVEMIPVGYPEEIPPARPRKAADEVVYYEKFGNINEIIEHLK
jgi:nitroreductase